VDGEGTDGPELHKRCSYLLREKRLIIYKYLRVIVRNLELYSYILVHRFKALFEK